MERDSLFLLLLFSLFCTCLGFSCADLQESQCQKLQTDGCIWSGNICSGPYSPSCIPPNCYYIDSNSASTATPDGTPAKPFTTLTAGLTKLSGKDGTLIIINTSGNMRVNMTAAASISSNITIKPLFDDVKYKIDMSNLPSTSRTVFLVRKYLKVIGASITTNFNIQVAIFYAMSASVYLEDVEIIDLPRPEADSMISILIRTSGSTAISSLTNCKIANVYGVFQAISSGKMIWKNVLVSGSNGLQTLMSSKTTLIMEDCTFTGYFKTALITLSGQSQSEIRNCTFRELAVSSNIFSATSVTLMIRDSIFDQIVSTDQRGLFYLSGVSGGPLTAVVTNCSLANIQAKASMFALEGPEVSLSLRNGTMANITQDSFKEDEATVRSTVKWFQGLCSTSVDNTEIFIESSNFSNIGSHCFWLEDTALNIVDSRFDNSELGVEETSILRDDISLLTEDSGGSWVSIKVTSNYEEQVYQVVIMDNKFIQNKLRPKYGGAIRFTGVFVSQLQISGNEFIGNTAYYGGAIYSDNPYAGLELSDNIFSDNSAYNGGAIYKISIESDEKSSGASLSTDGDQFLGNTAVKNGGALYLNWESIYFSNTEFISNQATNGGAIYFINLDEMYHNKYGGLANIDFIENSASNVGGSMKLFFKYSLLKVDGRVLILNGNSKEGVDEGRPAYYLLSFYDVIGQNQLGITESLGDCIVNDELTKLVFTMNTSETAVQFPEIQQKSGNELSQIMRVQVFDTDNKVADFINDEEVSFEIVSSENNISNYQASLVYNSIKFQFNKGQFLAKGTIQIHGEPKTTATLRLQNVADSSDFIQDSGMAGSFDLQVRFIDCEKGDIFEEQTRSCSTCAAGSYAINDPYTTTFCNECPNKLECYGGSKVGPIAGYWMYSLEALTAIKCPSPSACLGIIDTNRYSVQGECLYPHQGNLCNQCAPKHAKFGSSAKCRDCKSDVMYYIRLILFFMIQVVVVLCIHSCEKEDERNIFYLNVLKILVSFIQMNSVIISYDVGWSVLSKDAVDILNKLFPSEKDGFPIDCFLALVLPDNENINFVRLVVTFFQPFVLWGLCLLTYSCILLWSAKRPSDLRNKVKASLVSLFVICAFIVQPNMVLTALELFKCQNISAQESPELFLTSNSDIRCWTRSHMIWGYGFALPMFAIWGAILPFIFMIKTTSSRWKSFLYQGDRKETIFWEFVVIIFKTLVITVFTVFNSTSAEIQILMTFFICLPFTLLFLKLHPYQDLRLHISSLVSLLALNFMCYVGFFFLSNTWNSARMMVTSILLILVNCAVFAYPAFWTIKDLSRRTIIKTQKSRLEEAKPKLTVPDTERVFSVKDEKTNADESVVHNLSNHEIKVGHTLHSAQKESIDNYTIMQRSGSGLLSPFRVSSPLTKHPSIPSPPASRKDMIFPRGDFLSSSSIRHKKVYLKRLNMKSIRRVDDENIQYENTERTVTENGGSEITMSNPISRTQGENQSDNLLDFLKHNPIISSSNEEPLAKGEVNSE